MTHKEAVKILKELAAGRPWALIHETTSYTYLPIHCYIEGVGHAGDANTYEGAIKNIVDKINPTAPDPAPEDGGDV
jgi:hypothetical protein